MTRSTGRPPFRPFSHACLAGPRAVAARLILGAALCLFVLPAGCQLAGVVAYKLKGPPTIQAVYTPPKTPILVLAENFANPSMCRYEAEQLAWEIGKVLKEHEVAPIVSPDKLRQARQRLGDAIDTMSLSEIGRQLGAAQILYINIHDCQWKSLPGTRMVRGRMNVWVKMIDVDAARTRWPATVVAGHPMSIKIPYTAQDDTADGMAMKEQMCRKLGGKIARLFYTHKADEEAGQ